MFCKNCGKDIDDKAAICVGCGVSTITPVEIPVDDKDWLTTLLLCIFLGYLGVHRFYTKNTGIGVGQLLTGGGCGIWAFVDFILILTGSYKDGNGRALVRKN